MAATPIYGKKTFENLLLKNQKAADLGTWYVALGMWAYQVSSKIYDKRDDFNFEIVNSPFLDVDVPRSPSYGVYICSLFVLQECALILMTSTTETYF